MMKKNGFTLAEVLITLTIIGVVAMMTLPALMTNVQEQQAKTALKKGINTLSEAAQMNQAVDGFAYADLQAEGDDATMEAIGREQSLRGLLSNRTQVDSLLSVLGASDEPDHPDAVNNPTSPVGGVNIDRRVYFRDGAAVYFSAADSVADTNSRRIEPDGLPHGFPVIYDTNGIKGPNMLSTCAAVGDTGATDTFTNITAETGNISEGTAEECDDKGNRQIKDMFVLQLRGASVYPGGPAAKWASEK